MSESRIKNRFHGRMNKISICKHCGKSFSYNPYNKVGKYCSWECYKVCCKGKNNNNYKNAGIKICKVCKKEYNSYNSRRNVCSWSCANIFKTHKVIKICEWCKKEFSTNKARANKMRFCTRNCFSNYINQIGYITKTCEQCKNKFTIKKSLEQIRYCGVTCLGLARRQLYKGSGNPRWLGGCSDYRGDDWKENRRIAYERDIGACQRCGTQEARINVHHIIPYRISKNNSIENLISLCNKCHVSEENHYRIYFKPSFFILNYKAQERLLQ